MSKVKCVRRRCLLALALFASLAVTAAAQRRAGDLSLRPYVFENAKGEKTDAEFGTLLVPENRRDPRSNLIELAFVRFKSTSENPGPPVVYLAGGPGGSGIGAATGSRFPLFMAMREVGDVIAFDQRGTGRSKPNLSCYERWDFPLHVAPTRAELVRVARERSRSCAQYWRGIQRVDLAGYTTNESADDLDALRVALGAKQISLWGISYGTHLALATVRRHPRSVARLILAGTEGPDHTYKLPSNIERHLADLSAAVAADAEVGRDVPDLRALMRSVYERLEREPAVVEVTDPQTKQKVRVTVNKFMMQFLSASNIGTTTEEFYPLIYWRAARGDFAPTAEAWLRLSRSDFGNAMSFVMDCASGATAARRERIAREAKEALLGELADQAFPDVCAEWNAPDLGDEFRSPVRSDVPALFISGTLDARTPVSNAEEYRAGFANSAHLVIEGAVHSDPLFLSSPRIKEVMLDFMLGRPVTSEKITPPPMKFRPVRPQQSK
ncbi:MAG TPA: alpha/beta hydrolase [Pyrinomonadaceae bacterium]|nr:alpha/beta hydrolase [Pyrinomonadaceae bacterium]